MILKKLTLLMLSLILGMIFTSAMLSENGKAGKTGSPGESNCTNCHGDFANNSGGGSIAVTIPAITNGSYTPGTTYTVNAVITKTGSVVFGLGCEVLTASNTNAGTLIITNSTQTKLLSATVSSVSRQSVVHQLNGGLTNNTHTFSFNWTAPAIGTGPVTFYFSSVAGNHDGSESGDYVYTGSLALTEAAGCVTPVQPGTITGTASICAGTSQTYSIAAVNGATDYIWTLPSGWIGTSTTTSITATAGSSGNITVAAHNTCGTSPVQTLPITVTSNVTPSVNISSSTTTICAGTNVTFTATPTNGGTTPSYQWKLNGANIGTNSATYSSTSLANGNIVSCVMTSNANCVSPTIATSNSITMVVNAAVTPSISITANPGTTICAGTNVTFTATPINGGTTPSYQWKLNGANVGANSVTYTNTALANGNTISCVMTSNANCVSPTIATSNTLTIVVTTSITPTVSISAATGNTICSGTNVTFTATPTNGGTTPAYQWKLNGMNVGTNAITYSNSALTNNDQISCVMTSNAGCLSTPTATSNSITMIVNVAVIPSVSIAPIPGTTICSGTNVTFTATPTNGGTTPSYQWKLNGANVGTNSATYTNAALANGNIVSCVMTSNASCVTVSTATSNTVSMTVTSSVVPSVNIVANPGNTICAGTNVTFTATPTNGGTIPSYQWKLNGVNVGTNSVTYSNAALVNSDLVSCVMTSNAACVTSATATSNSVSITITTGVTPVVSIAASPGNTICTGTNVTFTATPTNGGTAPAYQWKLNGANVGTNSVTYSNAALVNSDLVSCVMTSNASCLATSSASSNVISIIISSTITPLVNITSSDDTICVGSNVIFTATPINGGTSPSYQWQVNGVNVGTNSATYSTSTLNNNDHVICILTSNAGCVTTNTASSNDIKIVVSGPIVTLASISPVCSTDSSFTLVGGSPIGGVYSGSGVLNGIFNPSTVGIGTSIITYTYTDNLGCSGSATTSIVVNNCGTTGCTQAPARPGYISGTSIVLCSASGVTYSVPLDINATSYNWTVSSNMAITANNGNSIVVSFTPSFSYGFISVSATNACGTSSVRYMIVYRIGINISRIQGQKTICPDNLIGNYSITPVSGALSYIWTVTGGATITYSANTAVVDFSNVTANYVTITVQVTSACQTKNKSMSIRVKDECDDDDRYDHEIISSDVNMKMQVYPNPSTNQFTIELVSSKTSDVKITLSDLNGKIVLIVDKKVIDGKNTININTSELNSGIYILRISGSENLNHIIIKN